MSQSQRSMRNTGKLLFVIAFSALSATPVLAHNDVVKVSPQYQTEVTELPEFVSMSFSEELLSDELASSNGIVVKSPSGITVSSGEAQVSAKTLTVSIDTSNTEQGTFEVQYRVASTDGHVVNGSYYFSVGADGKFDGTNKPSVTTSSDSSDTETEESKSVQTPLQWLAHFTHVHATHIWQTVAALLAIGLWALYRRHNS